MTESGAAFVDVMRSKVDEMLGACPRGRKGVAACPMVEPAGLDPANAVAIVEGTLDLLAGGPGTQDAERWAQVCTNSGKCIPACDYGVNPRLMVNLARIAVKTRQGDAAARRAAHEYFL